MLEWCGSSSKRWAMCFRPYLSRKILRSQQAQYLLLLPERSTQLHFRFAQRRGVLRGDLSVLFFLRLIYRNPNRMSLHIFDELG